MLASRVAGIGFLKKKRLNHLTLAERKLISGHEALVANMVVIGAVALIVLWGTGIPLSLVAKLLW